MIKPNWAVFSAKFSENPQDNFEWFCYLLFCNEFNRPAGIPRYRNQSAIETNPIEKGKEIIGWQAKHYDTSLTKHKDDLLVAVKKAKRDYPDITRIIFYTNQEWGQSKGKPPSSKLEIEAEAKEFGIELEWRTASFFESSVVTIQNEIISRHFFSQDRSVLDLIKQQQIHSENILNEIQAYITYNGRNIEIDRSEELEKVKNTSEKVLILSGVGGVGKTALVKRLYEQLKGKIPVYIFKASEFELRNIDDLFTGLNLQDFIKAHAAEKDRIVVIDSAEKLLDLRNTDPLKEFLTVLIRNEWRIIFTTRNNYLDDLNYQFFGIYKLVPLNIHIQNLELQELGAIADQYSFSIPKDEKLADLIRNPFYLNEYLNLYKEGEESTYINFKEKLWNKIIKKSKPEREQCFLKTAFERASSGHFFVNPGCEPQILDGQLRKDGIPGYESPHGYFITHDIYEEWALEKIIEAESTKRTCNRDFFADIGVSLPMRRAFRSWVSEKLLLEDHEIFAFIEIVIEDKEVDAFWKDEIFISVLLSGYSSKFFETFKRELLADNHNLMKRLTFLLRIACKEVDGEFFRQLGIKDLNLFSLKYVLTKPKGKGWESLIKFVYDNLSEVGIKNINFVLPIIHDWNSKSKKGETTRTSALIALEYYKWVIREDVYISRDRTEEDLLQTIIFGASEIKDELKGILGQVLKYRWKHHRDPYHKLSQLILMGIEGGTVSGLLPAHVIKLADLFWTHDPEMDDDAYHGSIGVDRYFGLEEHPLEYFPASSYQTPMYWLLQSSLKEAIDFFLKFTNRAVEHFAKSEFAKHEVEEVEVFPEEGRPIKQYISNRLWCTYRGTQVSPHLLESIHMALEKFLLEIGEKTDLATLEFWLLYLLRNARSASVSAVVASITLAFPEKTFGIAKVLFRTKDFFFYDTSRMVLDQQQKGSLLMLRNSFGSNPSKELFEDERIKACDDKHRKLSLENLFLNYQFFRSEETSEEESEKRQQVLWEILDRYYDQLPDRSEQTESDKTWRLYLARMDRRKMSPSTERTAEGVLIHLNPEIEPKLKEYSEKSLKESSEPMKYASLKLWAHFRMKRDDKYKSYTQYEENPNLAVAEVREIIQKIKAIGSVNPFRLEHSRDESFYLFNHSIPADACSVLVRDYLDRLSLEDEGFCKDIIIEAASASLRPGYQYQIGDGVESAISVLPILLRKFSDERVVIKTILLLTLFNSNPIGMYGQFSGYAVNAIISSLWKDSFDEAQSILLGYLLLKPKYEFLSEKLRKESISKRTYRLQETDVIERFLQENEADLQKVCASQILLDQIGDIGQLDLLTLGTAFLLIPTRTDNAEHKRIVKQIISAFADKLLSDDREDKIDYEIRQDFMQKLSYFVLNCKKEDIREYLEPFLSGFGAYESIADFLKEIVSAEDYTNSYENFWLVWDLFEEKVIGLCERGEGYWYVDRVIRSYLFAENLWKETATEWHSFHAENRRFFGTISEKIGHCPSVLYSVSKLLNGIGDLYFSDGISWISSMLQNNLNLWNAKLETNTIYYLENLVRKYIYENREKIRRNSRLRQEVLIILNFLIEKGSVIGYLLRENIL